MVLCICTILPASFLNAQDLSLSRDDLLIELRPDGGYHLFIRYKPDISSVLLTETTKDPRYPADNYAYRAAEKNPVNGNEIRLLDGYPIPEESRIYSLVSSTPEQHPVLGWAYHIYIPHILYYGYEGGRHGEVRVEDGTYLNIRAFYYAYADYRGPFKDNPFELRIMQESSPVVPQGAYMKETADAFFEIAGENTIYSTGTSDLAEQIKNIINKEKSAELDIVICLDTTSSMKPHIDAVKLQLTQMLREIITESPSFRIGMVLYRDYYDEYINKIIPFTDNFDKFQKNLNAVRVMGGGDIPEAVYEALYAGATKIPWAAESRIMILIGDAPPHPRPRGKITKQMVDAETAKQGIKVYAIILPK
jgi:Mg-chelatase subunit ChlD